MHSAVEVMPEHLPAEASTLTALWEHLDFFFSSYSFFLHFPVAWHNFYHILTVGQMASQTLLLSALTYRGVYCQLNNRKVSISCVCKRSPTHHRSTTVWCCDVFMLICWVWISSNVARLTPPPQSLLSFYPNYSRTLLFFFCFFFQKTNKPYLFSLFL